MLADDGLSLSFNIRLKKHVGGGGVSSAAAVVVVVKQRALVLSSTKFQKRDKPPCEDD